MDRTIRIYASISINYIIIMYLGCYGDVYSALPNYLNNHNFEPPLPQTARNTGTQCYSFYWF